MNTLKNTISCGIALILAVVFEANAFAATKNLVYSSPIESSPGTTVSIPICISNNCGIMGFSITVSYNADVFTPVNVGRGSALSSGLLNDSIGGTTTNSFRVIWTGTENFTGDGEIFSIEFYISSEAQGDYEIYLSYSKADTFDEEYTDVSLSCQNITVNLPSTDITESTNNPDNPDSNISLWDKIIAWFINVWQWVLELFNL